MLQFVCLCHLSKHRCFSVIRVSTNRTFHHSWMGKVFHTPILSVSGSWNSTKTTVGPPSFLVTW